MKILKNIFLALISIVALLLLIALFTNKEYHVVRNVTINNSSVEVYDYPQSVSLIGRSNNQLNNPLKKWLPMVSMS